MSREYFKGIEELYKYNAIVEFSEVFAKIYVPTDFKKHLDSGELSRLLNDQLREQGLMCQNLIIVGCSRIVEKNKHSKPIEKIHDNSNRLKEDLEKFHADEANGII